MTATTKRAAVRYCRPCRDRGDRVAASGRRAYGPDRVRVYCCEACAADDRAAEASEPDADAQLRRGFARVTDADARAVVRYAGGMLARIERAAALGLDVATVASDATEAFARSLGSLGSDAYAVAERDGTYEAPNGRRCDRATLRRWAVRRAATNGVRDAADAAQRFASLDAYGSADEADEALARLARTTADAYAVADRLSIYADAGRNGARGFRAEALARLSVRDAEALAAFDAEADAYVPPLGGRRVAQLRRAADAYVDRIPATAVGRTLARTVDGPAVWPVGPAPLTTDADRGPTFRAAFAAPDGPDATHRANANAHVRAFDRAADRAARAARCERERATRADRAEALRATLVVGAWSTGTDWRDGGGSAVATVSHASASRAADGAGWAGPAFDAMRAAARAYRATRARR